MKSLASRAAFRLFGTIAGAVQAVIRSGSAEGAREYFDPARFPWTAGVEADWRSIRRELDQVLVGRGAIPNFQDVSEEQRSITDDDRWKVYVFNVFGTPIRKNCERCPRTAELLQGIPGLRNAMFSILSPHKHIPEHCGPYNGLLRYHLALKVPKSAEDCSIRVNGLDRCWSEGRTLIFDDTFPHSVRNDTDEERVVLFADFERPLPPLLAGVNRAVLAVFALTPLARRPIERFRRGEI